MRGSGRPRPWNLWGPSRRAVESPAENFQLGGARETRVFPEAGFLVAIFGPRRRHLRMFLVESLYTESRDDVNPFLIGYRILGLRSVTNGKDYVFTNCKDYNS